MEHEFPFDPTYGYTRQTLVDVGAPPPPADYDTFWHDTFAQTRQIAPEPLLRHVGSQQGQEIFEFEFTGLGGFRVGGWLTRPIDGAVERGVIVGHGYGGRDAPDLEMPGPPAVHLFVCGRGFNRSASPDLPNSAVWHVIHGIADRQTYLHRFCIADMWSAVSALMELCPEVGDQVDYFGGSFGGGIGAMTLPWEPRFRRAFLDVPSFGNHPIRLQCECVGSGQAVRLYHRRHPEVTQVLSYYDAATASRFTTVPTFVAAAEFDPAVPPPGQFAVYNALPNKKRLFIRQAAHFTWPGQAGEDARLRRELNEWFA